MPTSDLIKKSTPFKIKSVFVNFIYNLLILAVQKIYYVFRQPAALQLLSNLYIGRSHHLWKDATILPWLERNVHVVLDLIDSNSSVIAEATEKRKVRYQGTPRNIYRHVILSDIKDASTSLPRVSIFVDNIQY